MEPREVSRVEVAAIAAFHQFMFLTNNQQTKCTITHEVGGTVEKYTFSLAGWETSYEFQFVNPGRYQWPTPRVLFVNQRIGNRYRVHCLEVRYLGKFIFTPDDKLKETIPSDEATQSQLLLEFLNDPSRAFIN